MKIEINGIEFDDPIIVMSRDQYKFLIALHRDDFDGKHFTTGKFTGIDIFIDDYCHDTIVVEREMWISPGTFDQKKWLERLNERDTFFGECGRIE